MLVIYASLGLLLPLTGCGEPRVEVFPVSGKVTFDGQAPVGAKIVLHAVNSAEPVTVSPIGTVKSDGSFAISAYEKGDGAPPGEYVATVQWYKLVPELGGPGPNVIPKEYTSPKTSPIKVTINANGPTTLEPITISFPKTARRAAGIAK